jgi:nitrite reductase/ring-hydroxylating ferredoxin subunit
MHASEQRLCRFDDLPDGGARGFDTNGGGQTTVFAVRRADRVHVYADSCPHHGTPMAWRRDAYLDAAGEHIVCSAHGALFEIDSGLCVLGPCLGDHLQALPCRISEGNLVLLAEVHTDSPHIRK